MGLGLGFWCLLVVWFLVVLVGCFGVVFGCVLVVDYFVF